MIIIAVVIVCVWLLCLLGGIAYGLIAKSIVRQRLEPTLLPLEEKIFEEKTCPYCAEMVKAEAIKCKHCGSDLPEHARGEG